MKKAGAGTGARRLRRLDDAEAIEPLSVDSSYDLNGTVGNPVAGNFSAPMTAIFLCDDKREPIIASARTTTRFVNPWAIGCANR
jgi:hypothetical protein